MRRFLVPALVLLLACGGGPVLAHESLEAEVLEIERLAVTAHWGESDRRIAALAPRVDELSELQRRRIEFVRLRNLGLAGDQPGALAASKAAAE